MASVAAFLLGLSGLVLSIYLLRLLSLIRTRGYGEGRVTELPGAGITLRCPEWWAEEANADAEPWVFAGLPLHLRTGNGRGVLAAGLANPELVPPPGPPPGPSSSLPPGPPSISPPGPSSSPPSHEDPAALRMGLEAILHRSGVVLDEPEIRIVPAGCGPLSPPGHRRAWVASNGREGPQAEARSYFEFHLLLVDGQILLLKYTNSVLRGFLDAFYIEKLLGTIQSL